MENLGTVTREDVLKAVGQISDLFKGRDVFVVIGMSESWVADFIEHNEAFFYDLPENNVGAFFMPAHTGADLELLLSGNPFEPKSNIKGLLPDAGDYTTVIKESLAKANSSIAAIKQQVAIVGRNCMLSATDMENLSYSLQHISNPDPIDAQMLTALEIGYKMVERPYMEFPKRTYYDRQQDRWRQRHHTNAKYKKR